MKKISQIEWRELMANDTAAVIIDVRTPEEWEDGIIENANMINVLELESFTRKASQIEREKNYYVYCHSGARSVTACKVLESLGMEGTFNLLGGILEWRGKKVIPA